MRDPRRTNALIVAALLMAAAVFAAYATLVMRWVTSPKTASSPAVAGDPDAQTALERARLDFREHLLDPRAHLRLSEALWKSGRLVDSFYVEYAARQFFPDDAFRRAHAEVVLGVGGPAAAARSRLKGLTDPALAVPIHAGVARDYPNSPEGRDSLNQLTQLAGALDGSDASRLAQTALEELVRDDPRNADKFAALAAAAIARGEPQAAAALANDAWNKHPGHAGAARVFGMLALRDRDLDAALKWLSAAWDRDSDDLYSAAKLAQLYDKRRGDPESALPFYLALYRLNPDYADDETAESRIRETLDLRRENLLKDVSVDALGARFSLDDASLRAGACLRAASFKDPRWINALGALLDDDAEIVRRSADYALFQIARQEPDAVRARREKWLTSDKPLVRVRALNLFADLDGRNGFPATVEAMKDPNPGVRAFAKVMVFDHYYKKLPEAARVRARYLAEEKDVDALAFERRFAGASR